MHSYALPSFWEAYQRLPGTVQQQADRAFEFFRANPYHRSLQFKRVGTVRPVYSARVGEHYRVLAYRQDDDLHWYWIGPHAEYDRLLRNL